MSFKNFTLQEAIKFGWDRMLKNIGFLILALIIAWVIPYLPSFISRLLSKHSQILSLFFSFLGFILSLMVQIGLIKISLKIYDGEKADFGDLFSQVHLFLKFLLGSILYGLVVLAGLLLVIVPGVIWMIKYQFLLYFIVDAEKGPLTAFRQSAEITQGIKWDLLALDLAVMGINLLGSFASCGLGLLITVPMTMLTMAFVYRRLTAGTSPEQIPIVPPPIS